MSDEVRARVTKFARQAVDIHLPVLVGLMAETGLESAEQSRRASALVQMLRRARVEPSITAGGRPVPFEINDSDAGRQLLINGEMLARVDDAALASALAETVAGVLDISAVSTGLVLQTLDEREMRGLAGRLGKNIETELIALTEIEELVSWRLETFEERLYGVVEGLGGWLEAPAVDRKEFIEFVASSKQRWPQWRDVSESRYIEIWLDEVDSELGRTEWADNTQALGEMLWESVAISPRSALRQAAQRLRSLSTDADENELLEILADIFGDEAGSVEGALEAWPSFNELQEAWLALWKEEDDALGARRRLFAVPQVSVFEAPGVAMGYSKPKNLPWDEPLLCWTLREREALKDLLGGTEKSLARERSQIRIGRLTTQSRNEMGPPTEDRRSVQWILQTPSRLPKLDDGFSEAVNEAFASVRAGYLKAYSNLDEMGKKQALNLSRGAYSGYLKSTKPVWKRRLASSQKKSRDQAFRALLTGVAEALEWPVFVDVFEQSIHRPPVASMPAFTIPAVWYEGADYAPLWLPVETLGGVLGQALLKIRNLAVDKDGQNVRWLGDHKIDIAQLEELDTGNLLGSINEGAAMLTIHEL